MQHTCNTILMVLLRMSICSCHARENWSICVEFVGVRIDEVLTEGGGRKESGEIEHIVARPCFRRESEFQLERSDDWTKKFLQKRRSSNSKWKVSQSSPSERGYKDENVQIKEDKVVEMMTYLGVDQRILWTCDENETLDFHEVGQFRWIQLPYSDRVGLLLMRSNELAKMSNEREICSYVTPPLGILSFRISARESREWKGPTNSKGTNEDTNDICILCFLNNSISSHKHTIRPSRFQPNALRCRIVRPNLSIPISSETL